MKALVCDLCGGKLIVGANGIATCDSCGIEYSADRMQEKIQELKGAVDAVSNTVQTAANDIVHSNKNEKLITAFVLNLIALFVSVLCLLFVMYVDDQGGIIDTVTQDLLLMMYCVAIIPIVTGIVGIVTKIILTKNTSKKAPAYIYLVFTLVTAIASLLSSLLLTITTCFLGIFSYIPLILYFVASIKYFQARK